MARELKLTTKSPLKNGSWSRWLFFLKRGKRPAYFEARNVMLVLGSCIWISWPFFSHFNAIININIPAVVFYLQLLYHTLFLEICRQKNPFMFVWLCSSNVASRVTPGPFSSSWITLIQQDLDLSRLQTSSVVHPNDWTWLVWNWECLHRDLVI